MRLVLVVLLSLLSVEGIPAFAEDAPVTPEEVSSRSGYENVRSVGGPNSVNSALRRHDSAKDSFFRLRGLESRVGPYYRFKRRMLDRHGLAFGMDFNVLYQGASASLRSRESSGGVFRFYGHWTACGSGTATKSEILFRVENRHKFNTRVSPEHFGEEVGSLLKTANSFADWGWGVTNLQWQQSFKDGRYGIAVGQVDLRDWVDTFDLSNWRTALLSAAVTYPTNPLPSAGIGGGVSAFFRECNTPYVLAGVGDANPHVNELGLDSFFNTQEYYSYVQVGWIPSVERKEDDNLHLTYWHQDAREEKGTPEGWGLSFSAAWKFQKRWAPFLRGGWAEGGVIPTRAALVGGLGIHRRSHDLFGVALGWATPYASGLRDQVTLETFYRLQLSQNIGITPDLELLYQPSNNPAETWIAVLSLRLQVVL